MKYNSVVISKFINENTILYLCDISSFLNRAAVCSLAVKLAKLELVLLLEKVSKETFSASFSKMFAEFQSSDVRPTIDINLPELEHVADHLKPTECRNLVILLHGSNPSFPNFIIPENKTCLELLVQWNSSPGLGRGQSHDVLTTKLHQLGHHNLSRWLSRDVFHQLAADVNASLVIATSTPSGGTTVAVERKQEGSGDDVVLSPTDLALSSILLVTSIFLIVVALISLVKNCAKKMKVRRKGPYEMLPDAERLHESLILIE